MNYTEINKLWAFSPMIQTRIYTMNIPINGGCIVKKTCIECSDKTMDKRSYYCRKCFEKVLTKKIKEDN